MVSLGKVKEGGQPIRKKKKIKNFNKKGLRQFDNPV